MASDSGTDPPAYAGVVIDLDGVCYRGDTAIPGSADAVARLRSTGVGVAFATNNATRTQKQSADKLRSLGFDAAPDEIITSAIAAADLVEPGTRCLVIGMQGLRDALTDRGCELVDDAAAADVVVTGLDHDLTYDKLVVGTRALLAGARFIASNTDGSFPAADGISPGAGIIVAALETATGRSPEIAGKPERTLFESAAARLPDGPTLMIGDRIETDLTGAASLGWDTALVLTGVSTRDDADAANPEPTYVADDLASLVARLLDGD
jgi:HAD superfamily hydrolase (TIGR01450 family)